MPGLHRIPVNGFGRMGCLLAKSVFAPQIIRPAEPEGECKELFGEQTTYMLHNYNPSAVTNVWIDPKAPVFHERYWNRQLPKDYLKKKKSRRRQQKRTARHIHKSNRL